ncbi:MAG: hypothetical protein V4506_13665 [Bacteroidota bacterium]
MHKNLIIKLNKKMKKLFTLVSIIGMTAFVACGPSAAEIEAKAKKTADSIAAVEAAAVAEAEAAAKVAAAEAEAMKAKASADSIAAAAEAAKPVKGGATHHTTTKPTKETAPAKTEPVKPGQGKG